MFNYLDGGADDERSLRRNSAAFSEYELIPSQLRNVENIDIRTQLLGCDVSMPVMLAPTGMSRLFHHHKEIAVAKAADRFGTLYCLSTMATTSLEDVAATTQAPKVFQIYILRDRGLTKEFVDRCKGAGYKALCLTVDTPMAGNRERDLATGMTMPPRLTLKSLWSFMTHPHWSLNFLLHPNFQLANIVHRKDVLRNGPLALIDYVNSQFDRSVTWDDAAWLVEQWNGPFVIKGLLTNDDAKRAREIGASAIMISNHGGRQLDCVPAPIDCVGPIRDAVGDALELIVDSGIRRGTDVLKALALGANACAIGRSYLYGLAAAGQAGVERVLELLRSEIERDLTLIGCASLCELSKRHIRHRSQLHPRD